MKLPSILFLSFFLPLSTVFGLEIDEDLVKNDVLVELAFTGNTDLVKFMVEDGMDPNTVNKNNASLILGASTKNNVNLLMYLVEKGANPNLANAQNVTPLYSACQFGNIKAVEFLLQNNANPNIAVNDAYVSTPLMTATMHGHIEIVKLLLKNGALINAINNEGKTAKELIQKENLSEIFDILDNHK